MPDFQLGSLENRIKQSGHPFLDKFLVVNTDLRNANVDKVLSLPVDTVSEMLWQGKFERMPGPPGPGSAISVPIPITERKSGNLVTWA